MPDIRELFDAGPDEYFRIQFAALQSDIHTAAISQVTETSDGHNVTHVPTVKRATLDQTRTQVTYQDFPVLMDTPVSFPGGAGATLTHGLVAGDELLTVFASRSFDVWRQNGGLQQPITDRMHDASDAVAIPGVRSDPRKIQQVAPDAMHMRDDAKHAVHELKPGAGVQSFHADPSTPPASASFDPLSQATKFLSHAVQAVRGIVGRAVDGGTEHSHGVDHGIGAWMKAMAPTGLVQALAHPDLGGLLSSADGAHMLQAHPEQGVMVNSAKQVSISAPPGMLSLAGLAAGGISGSAVSAGGDLSGNVGQAEVTNLSNVVGQDKALVQAASDAAAAASGVAVGSLYINTAVKAGMGVLAVRLA